MMRKRDAFTLVELLVVIGIIAVLIGILMPALSKAREQSQRTKCLSNIRQLGIGLVMYAAEYRDSCPLGAVITSVPAGSTLRNNPTVPVTGINIGDGQLAFSYFCYWGNELSGRRITGLGKLTALKMFKTSPLTYFCPKEERERLSYDTPTNPWPYYQDPIVQTVHSYLPYWVRPIAGFPAVDESHPGADTPFLIEGYFVSSSTASKDLPRGWPKLSKQKSKALISDIARGPVDISSRHKTGINVYYANGSAKYVNLGDFNKAQYSTAGPSLPGFPPTTSTTSWKNQTWITPDGAGNPPVDFASNMVYLNSKPTLPGNAGVWNWLDNAP